MSVTRASAENGSNAHMIPFRQVGQIHSEVRRHHFDAHASADHAVLWKRRAVASGATAVLCTAADFALAASPLEFRGARLDAVGSRLGWFNPGLASVVVTVILLIALFVAFRYASEFFPQTTPPTSLSLDDAGFSFSGAKGLVSMSWGDLRRCSWFFPTAVLQLTIKQWPGVLWLDLSGFALWDIYRLRRAMRRAKRTARRHGLPYQ